MVDAICKELIQRKAYALTPIETIYFGGGTPSLLSELELKKIFETIFNNYKIDNLLECTLEANPDDINNDYLNWLTHTPVNRLSMGVQSFRAADLKFMHRAHNEIEAESAIKLAQDKGLDNITIDLIYGTPGLDNKAWQDNLVKAIGLSINHISAYALTVEEKTLLAHQIKNGSSKAPIIEQTAQQFEQLIETLTNTGFEQYEISNFAKNKQYAVHNTNYWKGNHYIGIGPSAHSFNGYSRQWNISNNALYIKNIQNNNTHFDIEKLSKKDQINEYLLTGLRTMWGLDLKYISNTFGKPILEKLLINLNEINKSHYQLTTTHLRLTNAGKLFADGIASDLFF